MSCEDNTKIDDDGNKGHTYYEVFMKNIYIYIWWYNLYFLNLKDEENTYSIQLYWMIKGFFFKKRDKQTLNLTLLRGKKRTSEIGWNLELKNTQKKKRTNKNKSGEERGERECVCVYVFISKANSWPFTFFLIASIVNSRQMILKKK